MNLHNAKKIRISVISKIFFVFILILNQFACKKNKEIKSVKIIPVISVNEIRNTREPLKLLPHREQQDSIPEKNKTKYFDKGMFYYYLNRKIEYPDQLSEKISKAVKFTNREIKKYKLNSGKRTNKFSYYKVNHRFLKEPYDNIKFLLYYKTDNDKSASKILRIIHKNSTYDLILVSKFIKGNGIYILDSKFESESRFYQRIQFISNIKVNRYTDIDSFYFDESDVIIKNYTYDDSIFFHETNIDTIRFFSSFLIGKTFEVNGIKCFWKYNLTETNEYSMYLINAKNNNIILYSCCDLMAGIENISLDDTKQEDFIDLNFDGYTDYKEYRPVLSGNGGMLYIIYIYNPKTHFFEESDVLSGGNIRVDTLKKCLVSSWRGGGQSGPFSKTKTYFDNKGKIKYIENITNEIIDEIPNDSIRLFKIIRTYKKTIKDKIIESRVDTIIKDSQYIED